MSIEKEIQAKGLTAPRVTPADIEANIASEHYFTAADGVAGAGPVIAHEFHNLTTGHAIADYSEHTYVGHLSAENGYTSFPLVKKGDQSAPLGLLTFCVLVLRNGTKVVGVNYGAIDPARHDPEMGRTEARKAAIEQVWPLMGYELRTKLSQSQ